MMFIKIENILTLFLNVLDMIVMCLLLALAKSSPWLARKSLWNQSKKDLRKNKNSPSCQHEPITIPHTSFLSLHESFQQKTLA